MSQPASLERKATCVSVCAGLSIDVAVRRWQASTDTLNHLKLSVIQQCGQDWFPNQMQFYYENEQLTTDSLSLAQVTLLSSRCRRAHGADACHCHNDAANANGSPVRVCVGVQCSVKAGATIEMVINTELMGDYGDAFGADDPGQEQGFAGTALYQF